MDNTKDCIHGYSISKENLLPRALLTTLLLTACGAGQFFWVTTLTDNLELLDSKPALLDTITDDEGYSYYINYDQQQDSVHTASLNKLSPSGEQLWAVDITEISTTSDNATGTISLNGNIHIVIADNSNSQTRITWGHLSPEGDILNIDQFSVQGRTNPSVYGLDSLTSLLVYYSESDEDNKLQKLDILSASGKFTILTSSSGSGLSGIRVSNGQITASQYASDNKSIVALDFTGEELWRYELGSEALINWLRDGGSLYLHYRASSSDKKATFVAVDVISQSITAQSDIDNITLKTVTNDHNIVFTRETYSDTSKKKCRFFWVYLTLMAQSTGKQS